MTPTTIIHPDGSEMGPSISDRTPVSLGLVASLIGVAVAILLAYNALDKRVSAMEDRTRTVQSDIAEMKGDIKTLLRNQR